MLLRALLPALAAVCHAFYANYPTSINDTSTQKEPFFLRISAELIGDSPFDQALAAGRNLQLASAVSSNTTARQVVIDSSSPVLGLQLVDGTLHAFEFNSATGWTETGLVGVLAPYKQPYSSSSTTTPFEFVPGTASTPGASGWSLYYTQSDRNTYYTILPPKQPAATLEFPQICQETSKAGQNYFTVVQYIYYGYVPDRHHARRASEAGITCLDTGLETTLSPPLSGQS